MQTCTALPNLLGLKFLVPGIVDLRLTYQYIAVPMGLDCDIQNHLGEWAIASHGMYESHQIFSATESGKYEMILPVHQNPFSGCRDMILNT
jgi:hypothetical protein